MSFIHLCFLKVHGMGGVVGSLLTGFLAKNSIVLMGNDSSINGGAIDGNVCLIDIYVLFL